MRITGRLVVSGIATLLIIGGVAALSVPKIQTALQRYHGTRTNAQTLAAAKKDMVVRKDFSLQEPVALQLPRLNVTLAIKPGTYNADAQTWSLDRTSAFAMQPVTDEAGHTIPATPTIYGHDIAAVFLPLEGVAPDELLKITQQNGTTYTFRYVGDVVVKPHDTTELQTRYDQSVLLMTCTGSNFQERRILRFELVGEQDVAFGEVGHASIA